MPVQFLTTNPPSSTSFGDGLNPPALAGKAGEGIVAELHGKWYTSAYRNRVFLGVSTGGIIPINTTTALTFLLFNPLGSGVNVELVSADVVNNSITWVGSPIQLALGGSYGAALTTVTTTLTPVSALIGGSGVAQAKLYQSVAISAAAGTLLPLFGPSMVTSMAPVFHYEFDGKVILAPGSVAYLCGTAAQSASTANSFVWAEYPV